ncbi:glycosyltransferase [Pseudaestuariivita sp.]|uniref:glycosyltransferase n=1 Tax=Pseudaestuariivita sp. TaxID=2211669 RepID=UPI00405992C1
MGLHVVFQIKFGHGRDWVTEKRLDEELAYLTEITLPSLAEQTDQKFKLLMICDDRLSDITRSRIRHAVWNIIDPAKAKVIFRGAGRASKFLTRAAHGRWSDNPWQLQVAIDHDSSVAPDYVKHVRKAAKRRVRSMGPEEIRFFAFGTHYALEQTGGRTELYAKDGQYGDAGVCLLSPQGHSMSPFKLLHNAAQQDLPVELIDRSTSVWASLFGKRAERIADRIADLRGRRAARMADRAHLTVRPRVFN